MFSDGFADQFGGDKGLKFSRKAFENLIVKLGNLPMEKQKEHFEEAFMSWKGDFDQIDDVLVLAFKV